MRSRTTRAWSLFAAFLFSFILAPGAGAQISFGNDTIGAKPLGLSISGGISLGSYQAGVNFGLLELYRHAAWNPDFGTHWKIPRYHLRTVTGASAGNINTLLWAVEACTDLRDARGAYRSPDPEESLFWDVWLSIGWERLFNPRSDELALFDRKALIDDLVGPRLKERMRDPRLVEGCTVPAGITLTRILPDTLWLQKLDIVTQRHVTPFTLLVDSEQADLGTRVRFVHEDRIKPEDQYFGLLVRLQPHDGDIPINRLLEAVKASASFPVAFAPVELDVWYPGRGGDTDSFVDGGAFDNNPVGFARNLYGLRGDSTTLDILYVNPYRLRMELRDKREVEQERAPSGGLAAVMRTLGGAIPTARQYELQLVARERAHQARVDTLRALIAGLDSLVTPAQRRGLRMQLHGNADTLPAPTRERLLLSSRAYPVLGEHLSSFGAFLARPGREFDFYVGMYDALYMALTEHACSAFADTTGRASQLAHTCVGKLLPGLIQSPDLVRDPAREVLSLLYEREYGPIGRPAGELRTRDMEERVAVQRAFFTALGTQFTPVDAEVECHDKRVVYVLLCGDGLLDVLRSIGNNDDVVRILREWSRRCDRECLVEPSFVALVQEPAHGATVMLDQVIERLLQVEGMMKNRTRLHGGNYVTPVTAGQWLFHASHLRSRPVWEWSPNSIPETSGARLIPISYLGANFGTAGAEARYTPAWNFGNPLFARGNLIVHYNGEPLNSTDRWYGGAGASVGRYFTRIYVSELGVGANLFQPLDNLRGSALNPWEVEGYGVFVANQLRLGIRWMPDGDHRGLIHGRRGWAFSAGLNDPVGLAYWIGKIGG